MLYIIFRFILFLFFKTVLGLKVYGAENVPKKGTFLVASNHVSYLDPPLVGVACPRVLNFMARHDLFTNRAFGWLLKSVNVFPVKRNQADYGALKEGIRRLKEGKALVLFPEGTRSETGEIGKAAPGTGLLSLMTEVPILPAYVKGTDRALPKGAKLMRARPVSVHFGNLVDVRKLKLPEDRKEASQQLSDYVIDEIRSLKEKAERN